MSEPSAEPRQRSLFEASRDPILVHDVDDGRVVDANDAAERLLGYDATELAGATLGELGADVDGLEETGAALPSSDVESALEEARETGEASVQWQVERADSDRRWVDVTITLARLRGRERLLSFVRDVTEQRELTEDLQESREALRELHENQIREERPEEKVRAMLSTGVQFLDVEYAYLTNIDDGVQTIRQSVGEHEELAAGSTTPLSESYCQMTFGEDATDGLYSVLDASDEMAGTDAYARFGLESYVGKQVIVDGDVAGTVCFAGSTPRERPFSDAERMFVDVIAGWVGTELDGQRRQTALDERQRRVDALFNAPSSFIGVLDPDGTLIEANETALSMSDLDRVDVIGEPFAEAPWWNHDAELQATLRDAIDRARDGETVEFDATHPMPDGGEITAAVVIRPVVTDGDVETIIAHGIDVTEREQREHQLRAQQRRMQTVLENVPLVLFAIDDEGTFTLSKGNALSRLGLEEGEAVGENAFDLYAGQEALIDGFDRVLDGEPVSLRAQRGDLAFSTWLRPVREDGAVTGAIGVSVDVTEQYRQEQRLETLSTANRRLAYRETPGDVAEEAVDIVQEILEEPMSAFWTYDADVDALVPAAATDAAVELGGDGSLDALGTFGPGTHEYDAFEGGETVVVSDYEKTEAGGSDVDGLRTVAFAPFDDHGLLCVGRLHVEAFSDVERNLLAILANNATAAMDRAEREHALETYQQELERSNESLQQFAYVASHDLQEPLRMVSSYVDLLDMEYGDEFDEEAAEYMAFAVDGAERMRSMIDALLTYSRVETHAGEFERVDVDALLADVTKNLELRIEEVDADVTVEDLPTVRGDRDQLGQVFQNLLKNAIEHAGDDPPTVTVSCEEREDAYAFAVADEGVGIPENRQDAVFEIFESDHTSASGEGTGIGLAVVERIVHRHGGEIWVESEPGVGATFWFTVPEETTADSLHGDTQ